MSDRWLSAWALGSVAFGGASLLVPLYIVQLGASPVDLGLLAATATLVGAPGALFAGRLSNRALARRRLVLGTLVTVALTLAAVPLLDSVAAVIVANAVLWLVVAAASPVLTVLVVTDAPEPAWSERIGRLNKYQGYGWAAGLVLGTVWTALGTRLIAGPSVTAALFWLLAASAAVSAVLAARSLPAAPAAVTGEREVRKVARLLATTGRGVRGATFVFSPNRLYWTTRRLRPADLRARITPALATHLVAAALFFTGSAAFWAPLPLFLTDGGFSSGQVFGLYLAASLASAVLYERAGRLASRRDPRLLQAGALAVRALAFPVTALLLGLGTLPLELGATAAVLTVVGLTWAVIAVVGTALVTRLAPPAVRGEALGLYTAIGAVAGGVGGLLGGWLATAGYLLAFGVAGGLVLLGAGVTLSLRALPTGNR